MAEKIIIDIQLNDQASNKTLNELKANLKTLKTEIGNVAVGSDAFNKLSAEIAKTNIQIKEINKGFTTVANDVTHASNSIKGMEDHLKELKAQINTVGVGTKEFKDLQTQILKVDTNLKNTKKSIEGLDVEALAGHIGKLGGGITASFTAVSAVIGKGNADIEKFTANIVTGIAVSNGIKGITESWTSAQKLLNIAMSSNPIGVLITGVAALAGGIAYLVYEMNDYTEEQEALNVAQKEYNNIIVQSNIKTAEFEANLAKLKGETSLYYDELEKVNNLKADEAIAKLNDEYAKQLALLNDDNKLLEENNDLIAANALKVEKVSNTIIKLEAQKQKAIEDGNVALVKDLDDAIKANTIKRDNINKEIQATVDKNSKLIESNTNYSTKLKQIEADRDNANKLLREQEIIDEKAKNQKLLDERKKYVEYVKQTELNLFNLISDISIQTRKLLLDNSIVDNRELLGFYQEVNKELINNKILIAKQLDAIEIEQLERSYQATINSENEKLKTLKKGSEEYEKITNKIKELENEQFVYINILDTTQANKRGELREKLTKDIIAEYRVLQEERYLNNIKLIEGEEEAARYQLAITKNLELDKIDARIEAFKGNEALTEEEGNLIIELGKRRLAITDKYLKDELAITEEYLKKKADLQAKYDAEDLQRQITHLDKQAAIYEGDIARVADINKEKNDIILNQNINAIYKTQEEQFKALDEEAKKKILTEEEVAAEKKRIEEDSLRAVDDLKAENRKKNKDLDIKVQEELAAKGLDLLNKAQEAQLNGIINRINTEYNTQVKAYQAQEEALGDSYENKLITQSEYEAALKEIENKKNDADLINRQRIAKAQQEAALVQIAIETAVAVAKAAQLGPAAPLQIALAVATGAAQAAVVKSQPIPTYSKGGILNGPSHENGGVPIYANGGQIAEAEGGEIILNKNVSKIPALTQLASMINVSTGGKSFMANSSSISSNSALTATVDPMVIQSIVNSTVKGIASIPVQNVATQTTRVSRRVENVEASARY